MNKTIKLNKLNNQYNRNVVPPVHNEIPAPDLSKDSVSLGYYVPKKNKNDELNEGSELKNQKKINNGRYEGGVVPPVENQIPAPDLSKKRSSGYYVPKNYEKLNTIDIESTEQHIYTVNLININKSIISDSSADIAVSP